MTAFDLHSNWHRCYRGSTSKRRRWPEMGRPSWLAVSMVMVLLLTLQEQPLVDGLLLSPMPGYFLTSTILKKNKSQKTGNKRNRNNQSIIQVQQQQPQRQEREEEIAIDTENSQLIVRPPTSMPPAPSIGSATAYVKMPPTTAVRRPTSEKDLLIARAAKLRQSIVKQQDELIILERQIACCSEDGEARKQFRGSSSNNNNIVISGISYSIGSSSSLVTSLASRLVRTFRASSNVFLRKIDRVQKQVGPNNQQWEGRVGDYLFHEFFAGLRIASKLATEPSQIKQLVSDPRMPTLVPHAPAILARLDRLEVHVRPIIEGVLNDRQHLASIEPYLDEILERFDDIEPHLPWILKNIDLLAPYTGLLLKHIDALLMYANVDEEEYGGGVEGSSKKASKSYSLADQLLPFLEYYVSKLDTIGPHLVLLRPHVPLLLKHNRIAKVSPHIDKLFARGYESRLAASANIDVLLFWFGWTLRIPFAPALFFALPFSPQLVSFLASRLPRKFARRGKSYCRNLECAIDDDYGGSWNKLDKT